MIANSTCPVKGFGGFSEKYEGVKCGDMCELSHKIVKYGSFKTENLYKTLTSIWTADIMKVWIRIILG